MLLGITNETLTFGNDVNSYRSGRKRYPDEAIYFIKRIFRERQKQSILDIGCGTGIATRQLADKDFDIFGCDADERMISAANKVKIKYNIKYLQNLPHSLPYESTSLDAITTFSSFHWCNTRVMVNEIKRVLKRSGLFVVVNVEDINNVKHSLRRQLLPFIGSQNVYQSSKRGYFPARQLKDAGLEILDQLHFYKTEIYSLHQLCSFAKSLKVWSEIPASEQDNALKEVIKYFTKYNTHNYVLRDIKVNVIVAEK